MFEVHSSTVRHELGSVPVELPFDVLLALPDYVGGDPAAPVFDLPSAMGRLLGRFGWEGASRIIRPRIWAPGWSAEQLRRFVASPFTNHRSLFDQNALAGLAVPHFPGTGWKREDAPPEAPYDVVHVLARIEEAAGLWLVLADAPERGLEASALSEALGAAQTRLLILQVAERDGPVAQRLAERLLAEGGPAVLVVAASPAWVDPYLHKVYADMVHNRSLTDLATPPEGTALPHDELIVHLYVGQGGEDLLRLDPWLDAVQRRAGELSGEIEALRASAPPPRLSDVLPAAEHRLHRSQQQALDARFRAAHQRLDRLAADATSAWDEVWRKLDWARESGGAEPLSRVAELVGRIADEVAAARREIPQLEAEAQSAEHEAPRVLNANFARAAETSSEPPSVLHPQEPLVAGRRYDLLIDIGPRWVAVPSLVTGHAAFPDEALPESEDGHVIAVLFVSDDFEPRQSRGQLWLPSTGRSRPILGGQAPSAAEEGPLALPLTARAFAEDAVLPDRATGRLFLYYENNLLQSAAVETGLLADWKANEVPPHQNLRNRIDVDYVLSGTLSGLDARYSRRRLRLAADEEARPHRLRLNLTLNHDPIGTHRILVRGEDLAPAWTAYDPAAARESLRSARQAMLDCYWKRDGRGRFVEERGRRPVPALDANGGKSRIDLATDLFLLARAGHRLYGEMLHSLRPADGSDPIEWERALRERLEEAAVLQVSRIESAPTQYAFPWGLLYEYPMPSPSMRWTWCHVLREEWAEDGRRQGPLRKACPYHHEHWHSQDVLCPYGFWGLKHVIEQPLAARSLEDGVREAEREVRVGGEVPVAIGWTRDTALDLQRIDAHVQTIRALGGVRLASPPPNPAHDRDTVRAVLPSSALAYFLCHCEDDLAEGEPFLWLGPRSDDPAGKIYVTTVTDWARAGLGDWARQRPLVFINGCHSGDLTPGEVLNFVSAFGLAGASGIIGTEVAVQLDVAVLVGELLLAELLRSGAGGGTGIGQAVRDVRWQLADRGNLLGLCYTFYGLADLHLVRDGEHSQAVDTS